MVVSSLNVKKFGMLNLLKNRAMKIIFYFYVAVGGKLEIDSIQSFDQCQNRDAYSGNVVCNVYELIYENRNSRYNETEKQKKD